MRHRFFTMFVTVVGVVLLVGLPTGAAAQDEAPESFGPNVHYLNISPPEFACSDTNGDCEYSNCVEGYWCSGPAWRSLFAKVHLPAGAQILGFRVFFEDSSSSGNLSATLMKYWNTDTFRDTDILEGYSSSESGTPGITSVWVDVDPDVIVRYRYLLLSRYYYNTYLMRVRMYPSTDINFGGVLISWKRQVSPKPGSATFADVPRSHPFFQFVEALVASGITAGCGGGNYCPDDPVTRGQMAVYLAAALGLHWES